MIRIVDSLEASRLSLDSLLVLFHYLFDYLFSKKAKVLLEEDLSKTYKNKIMKEKEVKHVEINNRKAKFNYTVVDTYVAGIVLQGNEVKSIVTKIGEIVEKEMKARIARESRDSLEASRLSTILIKI